MPFDTAKFATYLRDNQVGGFGIGKCATHVRLALEAGGLGTAGHPRDAKDYGPFLKRLGFRELSAAGYIPQTGDIVVLPGNEKSAAGHVAGWDGQNWVSDFVQREIYPGPAYRKKGQYVLYRL